MISIVIPLLFILVIICVKLCLDIMEMLSFLRKDKELIQQKNYFEKNYQFIK